MLKALPKITGYAAVFNSRSEDLGGFVEIIEPGAFSGSLESADVRALVGHDATQVIGRNKSGTLNVFEDDHGLRVEIDPPNTSAGRDIVESVRRGDIDSMSFGFIATNDRWEYDDGQEVRYLEQVELLEVSVVAWPAYQSTEVAVRSLLEAKEEPRAWMTSHIQLKPTIMIEVRFWKKKTEKRILERRKILNYGCGSQRVKTSNFF